jgi:hypothetical protein
MKAVINNVEISLIKTKRPKMTEHRGRTWDTISVIINGVEQDMWLDTSWGDYGYIVLNNQWYKFKHMQIDI